MDHANCACSRSTIMSWFTNIINDEYRTRKRWNPCVVSIFVLLSFVPKGHSFSTVRTILPRRTILPLPQKRTHTLKPSHMLPELFHGAYQMLTSVVSEPVMELPWHELGEELSNALDIGTAFSNELQKIPERETAIVIESMGYDLLVFLTASVVVTTVCKGLKITPILGYLVAGALLGPHALDVFANSKADIELGDFGILFLLFSEGLDVSSERLKQLSNYLPLGLAQISLTTGVITAAVLVGVPQLLDKILPLDSAMISIHSPIEAVVLGLIGALSTSAFIFPVLKERGWEEEPSGQASTSILLLQDLMVAPLLVVLPYLVGDSTEWAAIGFLTAKATIGFGTVMWLGSYALQRLFALVAQAQSTETFVALCLLVSVGMGIIAKSLGLTDTAGAFAAGVLLANTNYRAQIQADILPFKGILLGIFFMGAGSTFDLELVTNHFPTIFTAAIALYITKALTLLLATRVPEWMEPNRLNWRDAIRVSLLLAGGGEFAFVVLAMAEKLHVVPEELGALLSATVLITMGLTPIFGDIAAKISESFEVDEEKLCPPYELQEAVARDAVVVCGYGEVGQSLVEILEDERSRRGEAESDVDDCFECPHVVAFDTDPSLINHSLRPGYDTIVIYGNGANGEVIRSSGVTSPTAIFVCYEKLNQQVSAITKLRGYFPNTPIFSRATTRSAAQTLKALGATEVIVEADELPKSAAALIRGVYSRRMQEQEGFSENDDFLSMAASAAGLSLADVGKLQELYKSMDQDGTGQITIQEIEDILERSSNWIATDDEIKALDSYVETYLANVEETITFVDLCRLYGMAPDFVKRSFGLEKTEKTDSHEPAEYVALDSNID